MEKLLSKDCMIIEKEEYNRLKEEIKSLQKELYESQPHVYMDVYINNSGHLDPYFSTNILISSDLKYKIFRRLHESFAKISEEYYSEIEAKIIKMKEEFNSLPWYKKMFYKYDETNKEINSIM